MSFDTCGGRLPLHILLAASLFAGFGMPSFSQSTSLHQPTAADFNIERLRQDPMAIHAQYGRFLRHICNNGQQSTTGSSSSDERLEYERLAGFPPESVTAMISITHTTCPEYLAIETETARIAISQTEQSATDQAAGSGKIAALKSLRQQRWALIDQTRTQIEGTMSAPQFTRLDDWILLYERIKEESDSLNSNGHSRAAVTSPLAHHQSPLRVRYMFFLIHLGREDQRVRYYNSEEGQADAARLDASGQIAPKERQPYAEMIGLTPEETATMVSVGLAGYHDIVAKEQEIVAAIAQRRSEYTQEQRMHMPPSPQIEQLNEQRWELVEQTVNRFHQALGDSSFEKFDPWVQLHYGHTNPRPLPSKGRLAPRPKPGSA